MRHTKTQSLYRLLILSAACLFLLVSGCASIGRWTWQHPEGLDTVALQQAQNECRRLAENEAASINYYRQFYAPFYYDRYYRNGHIRHYYPRHSYYDFRRYNNNLEKLYSFCLQAKGWRRVSVDRSKQ